MAFPGGVSHVRGCDGASWADEAEGQRVDLVVVLEPSPRAAPVGAPTTSAVVSTLPRVPLTTAPRRVGWPHGGRPTPRRRRPSGSAGGAVAPTGPSTTASPTTALLHTGWPRGAGERPSPPRLALAHSPPWTCSAPVRTRSIGTGRAERGCCRCRPWPTQLDKIKNLHAADTIDTEDSGTPGRSDWDGLTGKADQVMARSSISRKRTKSSYGTLYGSNDLPARPAFLRAAADCWAEAALAASAVADLMA